MQKLFLLPCLTACLFSACSIFEIDEISDRVGALEDRVAELEELCNSINSDISSLNTIVKALQTNDYVTGVTPIVSNRIEIGFIISFKYADPISIYHGENGKDGEDGKDGKDGVDGKNAVAPVISIKAASDGIYYWTVDGEWLLNENGDKVQAAGTTPQLKIEEEYWYVSYDGGKTWDRLGKATGEDGSDGTDGDSMFRKVTQDDENVYFTLADGTVLTLPKQSVLSVSFAQGNTVYAAAGLTTEVDYTVTSSLSSVTVEAIGSGDIKAMALPASSGALYGKIKITVGDTIDDYSKVVVLVSNGNRVIMSTISIKPKLFGGSSNDPFDEDDEWSNLFD